MKNIDCVGDMCPVPIIKIQKALKTSKKGDEIILTTDHSCTVEEVLSLLKNKNYDICVDEVMNGIWEITVIVK